MQLEKKTRYGILVACQAAQGAGVHVKVITPHSFCGPLANFIGVSLVSVKAWVDDFIP